MKLFVNIAVLLLSAAVGLAVAGNYSFLDKAPIKNFTERDIELLKEAVWEALDNSPDGKITGWRNPDTEASGKLKPLRTYQTHGTTCRKLQIANQAGGLKNNVAFDFCRQPDDSWKVLN